MRLALFDFRQSVDYRLEILSGLTVAMALIPEAVAFALIAGLSPLTGLYAAFVVGLTASVLGGRPGMISGATGAVAVVIAALVVTHGPEYIFGTVILLGLMQAAAGFLKLGKLMRLVPQPVIFGFVNGLAIIIGGSQIDQFKTDGGEWLHGGELGVFVALTLLSMAMLKSIKILLKSESSYSMFSSLFLRIRDRLVSDLDNSRVLSTSWFHSEDPWSTWDS